MITSNALLKSISAIAAFFLSLVSSHAVLLSAGEVTGLAGDLVWTQQSGGTIVNFTDQNSTGSPIHIQLDLLSVQNVGAFLITNRLTSTTNANAKTVTILVAADESAPGFDPTDIADYTQVVFSGTIMPSTNVAGTQRTVDISDSSRRYFLFDFTENFTGAIGGANITVQVSDIALEIVPEPSSVALILSSLGIGVSLFFRRRRLNA